MIYKIGDKVRIRHDLEEMHHSIYPGIVSSMHCYQGVVATVTGVSEVYRPEADFIYRLDVDYGKYLWGADFFEEIRGNFSPSKNSLMEFLSAELDEK